MHTTIRVELSVAKHEDHIALHKLMSQGGFLRHLVVEGVSRDLPEGLYLRTEPISMDDAIRFAEECVARIRRRAIIFATNGTESRLAGQAALRPQTTREMLAQR